MGIISLQILQEVAREKYDLAGALWKDVLEKTIWWSILFMMSMP